MTDGSRRRRFRFSLRTLLIAVLLLGSTVSLWLNWQPWYRVSTLSGRFDSIHIAAFSEDCSRVIWLGGDWVAHVMDARTGAEIEKHSLPNAENHAVGIYAGHAICATAGHVNTPKAQESWRVDFRSRHSNPVKLSVQVGTIDEALEMLMTSELHENFVYNQEVIDCGRTQKAISLTARQGDALAILDEILSLAELAPEFHDGAIHVVRRETHLAHMAEKEDNTVRIWELETGKQVATLSGQISKITAVAISLDGTHVLAASDNSTARVWETGGLKVAAFHSADGPIHVAALSNNAKRVAGSMSLTKIGAWNTENDSNIFVSTDLGSTDAVAISSDGRFATFHYQNKSIELWDLNAGTRLQSLRRQFIGDTVEMAPQFSLRGDRLVVVCSGKSWLLSPLDEKETELDGRIRAANFSFDNERIAATYDWGSTIINTEDGKTLADLPDEPRRLLNTFSLSKPKLVMVASSSRELPPPATPQFSLDRSLVIATDGDGRLGVWALRHNEMWWGIASRIEFWLTVVFAGAFVWSLRRDRREV